MERVARFSMERPVSSTAGERSSITAGERSSITAALATRPRRAVMRRNCMVVVFRVVGEVNWLIMLRLLG